MKALLLGSGGREHALAWKMVQSPLVDLLYWCPGNAGTLPKCESRPLDINDPSAVSSFLKSNQISLLVVGPEQPLVDGLVDHLRKDPELKDLHIVGPGAEGAKLEGSKDFAKEFMTRHGIPTAHHRTFTSETIEEARRYIRDEEKAPYVLKADGLAAGKGVLISSTTEEALDALESILGGQFGNAGNKVVIETFLSGIECSVFVLTDGIHYQKLPTAKDYKRVGEGDTGLNTGGMGAVSPVPFADEAFMQKVEERIIKPTIRGLKDEKIDYRGFIFFGLIKCGEDPYVIEYNCRMGDPETEVVMLRIEDDLIPAMMSLKDQSLDRHPIRISPSSATTVVAVSGGYPQSYAKGKLISGLEHDLPETIVFHAGTTRDAGDNILTSGGRVLAVSATGEGLSESLARSYERLKNITFEGIHFRSDIGQDLLTDHH